MTTSLDAVLAQYEKNKNVSQSSGNRMSQEDRLKRYFTTALPKGTKSGEKRIRILPTADGSSPFTEVWFHNVQVQGKWVKLYDPGKNSDGSPTGERSPLSEVEEALKLAGDAQSKELARQYRSSKFYIVKVIDRDKEEDGVKFWRFKHNWRGDGPLDKIIPIWKNKGDITNPQEGRDLLLILQAVPLPSGRGEYTTISSVMYDDPEPLSSETTQSDEWIKASSEVNWTDVYSQRPVEYLEAIANGVDPVWDNELKKYVYDTPTKKTESTTEVSTPTQNVVDPQTGQKADEDLPF